jgi:hypothetical protein
LNTLLRILKIPTHALRRIFNLAIEPRGYLRDRQNPFIKLKERKKPQKPVMYVSVDEYRALMNAAQQLWWKNQSLLRTAAGTTLVHCYFWC